MARAKQAKFDISAKVASIILAGGQGTRLFPLTVNRCKPAVSFGGSYRLIDIPLSNSLNSKIKKVFVISQYFTNELHNHIRNTYNQTLLKKGIIELLSPKTDSAESYFKGTADAVRQNLKEIMDSSVEYILILSGDQLYNIDFKEMISFAISKNADLVIASLPIEKKEASRMGLMRIDADSKIVDFAEKPKDEAVLERFQVSSEMLKGKKGIKPNEAYYLASMGIYIFKKEALASLLKEDGEDFGKHIIPLQLHRGNTYCYMYDGYWEDIGTISSYYHANLALTNNESFLDSYDEANPIYSPPYHLPCPVIHDTIIKQSLISQGAIIEAKEISHSIVGMRTHIDKGSVIKDSIIIGNENSATLTKKKAASPITIGKNCYIEKAIIDENTSIGDNVVLKNEGNLQYFDGDGFYVRDGILIVTAGSKIPSNFRF